MDSKQVINNPYVPPPRPVLLAGRHGWPKLIMTGVDGAQAELYLRGAQLASWTPAGGREWLFLSEQDGPRSAEPLRGGVALLFPEPGTTPSSATLDWSLIRVSQSHAAVTALLRLTDSRATRREWRHRFQLGLLVTVSGVRLVLQWHIKNTGQQPLPFAPLVQQYLRLDAGIANVRLEGHYQHDLRRGARACDLLPDPATMPGCQRRSPNFGQPLLLHDGTRTLQVASSGLSALEVWHPSPDEAARLLGLALGEARGFLRLQAGSGSAPLELQPGELWRAELALSAGQPPRLVTTP